MDSMRRLFLLAVATLTACSGALPAATTAAPTPPETVAATQVTNTAPVQPTEVRDCSTPQVPFSALCEVYDLIDTRYPEPVDPQRLAGEAVAALAAFRTDETEPPPRTLFCSIPAADFVELCALLARRVAEEHLPVGPAVDAAVAAMVNFGLDPFSSYLGPDQVLSVRDDGLVGGVGFLLDARDAAGSRCLKIATVCPLEVVLVLDSSPAATAGVEPGDRIVAIDGVPVDGMSFASAGAAIAGDETGQVELRVQRGDTTLAFTIRRAPLSTPAVEYGAVLPRVGYLRIPDFGDDVPPLVAEALTELAEVGPRTIVVDLRDNPGGSIDSVVEVASMFISNGTVLVSRTRNETVEYSVSGPVLAPEPRLVVLVNRATASAAEVLAGALQDRRQAMLVGTATYGKDAIQIPFQLRNGGRLQLTVARWTTPGGTTPSLLPDRELEWDADMTVEQVVAAALEAAP